MAAGTEQATRGMVFTLDPSPAEERLLWSYWGAAHKAHNWVIAHVKNNLAVRKAERAAGVAEERSPALHAGPASTGGSPRPGPCTCII